MSAAAPVTPKRYRRRILALGGLVFVFTFAIGAAIFIPIVQNDLEDRVEEALVDNDIAGVTASFSGQDGTLVCAQPLDDPERSLDVANGLWGVRTVSLDRTCFPDDETAGGAPTTVTGVDTADGSTPSSETAVPTTGGPAVTEPDLDSLADLVASDPLFSQLAGLVEVAELGGVDGLGGDGPLTVFAPTDAAFDAVFDQLGADAFGAVTSDPALLRTLLLHHVTEARIMSDELTTGSLTMLDGTDIEVDADSVTFTSGSSVAGVADPATQLDIEASNGVVHAIDRILVPPGLDLSPASPGPAATAVFENGRLVLAGSVGNEEQRAQLLAAAGGIDQANVVDELTVDAATAPPPGDVDRFAIVVEAMPANLVVGTASVGDGDVDLVGVVRDTEARTALEQLGVGAGVGLELSDRPIGDATTAQGLEDELNAFVAANPVTFEPGSIELTAEADAVIDQLAARALRLDEVDLVVVGHTDTDGSAETNQFLSEGRAAVVRAALVERGLDADAVTAAGRGEDEPVVGDDGVEDKAASRRVEFVVTAR